MISHDTMSADTDCQGVPGFACAHLHLLVSDSTTLTSSIKPAYIIDQRKLGLKTIFPDNIDCVDNLKSSLHLTQF